MGTNYVEREGISLSHPAQFILVGTMNPEEGDLRPQLLDRFALAVEVAGPGRPRRARRGRAPADRVRGRPGRLRGALAGCRGRGAGAHPGSRATCCRPCILDDRMLDLITHLCTRLPGGRPARRHRDVQDGRDAGRLRRAHAASTRRTCATRPSLRCSTAGGASRSSSRAWTRPTSTARSSSTAPRQPPETEPQDEPRRLRRRRPTSRTSRGRATTGRAPAEEQVVAASDPYAVRTLAPQSDRGRSGRPERASGAGSASQDGPGRLCPGAGCGRDRRDLALDATRAGGSAPPASAVASSSRTARRCSSEVGRPPREGP